ncbi:hypothetical protein HWV62_26713 [Athelia sp. TMB]|nr:hypothetical protein HWV62_26713 [Athelia sp. TMB]
MVRKASGASDLQVTPSKSINVIVCGQAGVGKSSIINMLAGKEIATTSNDMIGCTFKSEPYVVARPGHRAITLWDTAGLDEGPTGRVTALAAMKNIFKLTSQLSESTGLSLIIYVVKGKLVGNIVKNYLLFKAFCDDKVPLALVVTGLDDVDDKVAWWGRNERYFKQAGLLSAGHACIVATKQPHTADAYDQSTEEVFDLIETTSLSTPWATESRNWFIRVVTKVVGILLVSARSPERGQILYEGLLQNSISEQEAIDAAKILTPGFVPS